MNRRLLNTGENVPLQIDEVYIEGPPEKGIVVKVIIFKYI